MNVVGRVLLSLAFLLPSVVSAQDSTSSAAPPTDTPCSPLELVVARGTGEPGPLGVIVGDPLFNYTKDLIPDATAYAVQYPANFSFGVSVAIGINDTIQHLTTQPERCPDQKYVVVGYSQGSAVTHSALQDTRFPQSTLEKIVAVVQYGDPTMKGQGGPGALNALPTQLRGRLRENCECGDSVCSNGTSFVLHIQYAARERGYHNISADYIKKAFDTDGLQEDSIYTSCDNNTLLACTNTTLADGTLGFTSSSTCDASSNTTLSRSIFPSSSRGTGTVVIPSNSTSAVGTGTGASSTKIRTSLVGTGTGVFSTKSSTSVIGTGTGVSSTKLPYGTGNSTGTGSGSLYPTASYKWSYSPSGKPYQYQTCTEE